jgi:hypothetical protein
MSDIVLQTQWYLYILLKLIVIVIKCIMSVIIFLFDSNSMVAWLLLGSIIIKYLLTVRLSAKGSNNVKFPFTSVIFDVLLLKYRLICYEFIDWHGYNLSNTVRYSPCNNS